MESLTERIARFLRLSIGKGRGKGRGNGRGYGDGYGDGIGNGIGNAMGNGYGDGIGYGDGFGDGYGRGSGKGNAMGNGYGDGYGDGYGKGSGKGNASGGGYGYASGEGYGDGKGGGKGGGIKRHDWHDIYVIDEIPTAITNVHGNFAKGYTLRNNVQTSPCYIARVGNCFAHGNTAKEAYADALAKYQRNQTLSERIADFIKRYPSLDSTATHKDLFRWHNVLTDSCKFGRLEFCRVHNLDPEQGKMTVQQFLDLTINDYGGNIIKQIKNEYKRLNNEK